MATPIHARIRIGGTLYGNCNWSIGMGVTQPDGGDPFSALTFDVQSTLQDFATNVRGLNGNGILPPRALNLLSTAGQVTFVRASRVGADGKETAVALFENPGGLSAGQSTPYHPGQSALVLSLLTARPGASYRGRVYLPAAGVPLGATGRYTTAFTAEIIPELAVWTQQIGAAFPVGAAQNVANRVAVISAARGLALPVTRVRVGDRLDTQRRRADGDPESYSVSQVPN